MTHPISSRSLARVLSVISLCLVAVLALPGCSDSGPADRAEGYIRASLSGDADQIKQYHAPQSQDNEAMDRMLSVMAGGSKLRADQKGGLDRVEVTKTETSGDSATVSLKVHWGDGSSEPVSVKLQRIDGQWYVIR